MDGSGNLYILHSGEILPNDITKNYYIIMILLEGISYS